MPVDTNAEEKEPGSSSQPCAQCATPIIDGHASVECFGRCKLSIHVRCLPGATEEEIVLLQKIHNAVFVCDACLALNEFEDRHSEKRLDEIAKKLDDLAGVMEMAKNFKQTVKKIVCEEIVRINKRSTDAGGDKDELPRRILTRSSAKRRKVDECENHNDETPKTSFADAVKGRTDNKTLEQIKRKDSIQKPDPVVIIRPKEGIQVDDARAELRRKVDARSVNVKRATNGKNGEVVIALKDDESVELLKKHVEQNMDGKYDVSVRENLRPTIKLVGMSDVLDENELRDTLVSQNDVFENLTHFKLRKAYRNEKFQFNNCSAIIELDAKTFTAVMQKEKLNCGKGDKQNVANYRGITSLCAGSKLFEILVGNVLFRETRAYISKDQHGFFPGRSTTTNLAQFTSLCIKNIELGSQVDTVYTDLKAAFDRVDHSLLLAKMKRLGASDYFIGWLKSYLVNRSLCVKLGNNESYSFINLSGVPQGSNLGPLLFSLFFNDVCFVIPPGCRLIYADDLKLFLIVRSIEDCKELQKHLDAFSCWCNRNLLALSVSKCSIISFTRRKNPILWNYTISGESLERMTVVRDLGVLLDSQLTFRNHYSHVTAQANRNLGFIIRIAKEFTDPYCLRALYFSLVRSVLEASAPIWCPYTSIWINRIEAVQARFLRFALRTLPWRNPTELPPYIDRCRLLDMETLAKRRNTFRAVFVGKILTGQIDAPDILSQINVNVPPRSLRSHNFLRLEFQRTEYGQKEPNIEIDLNYGPTSFGDTS
ncbi:uncharacterized protein LOC131687719 [Topomyia yanbarensis]|uniref:uncharacterized protein LOC131687719 n=1 Tax=Topomyia yanbarensis TaxID=2498891 RepID=UPI00273B1F3E|nr:uncharacterized protein LOC131687719 [Topomyia yanbarensis]